MNEPSRRRRVLVSDFDGTMTRHDFYGLVVERLLPPGTPDYWAEYRAGRLSHFDALNAYFAAARPDETALDRIVSDMGLDPNLRQSVELLRAAGWEVVVTSAGCLWYINRLLAGAGVELEVHGNPGELVGGRLRMRRPVESPFYSPSTGIDKAAVVHRALDSAECVAFAGDGPPDLEPALLVAPAFRFATGHLAAELERRGEPFRRFEVWSQVAKALVAEGQP